MPIYEYCCNHCGKRFEKLRTLDEFSEPFKCPHCKKATQKLISSFACKVGPYIKNGDESLSSKAVYLKSQYYSSWKNSFIYFRLSYTCMAVGVSFSMIPPPEPIELMQLIDLLFFLFSIVFLIAVIVFQYRDSSFNNQILKFGNGLSFVFLLFSIMFIIVNWVKIMQILYSTPNQNPAQVTSMEQLYSSLVIPWILFFASTFVFVAVMTTRKTIKEIGLEMVIIQFGLVIIWFGGTIGLFRLPYCNVISEIPKYILISESLLLVLMSMYYFYIFYKDKKLDDTQAEDIKYR